MPEELAGQDTPGVNAEAQNLQSGAANPETTEAQTAGAEGGEKQVPEAKTFTQEEVDGIVGKRVAEATSKAERRAEARVMRQVRELLPTMQQPHQQQRQQTQHAEDLDRREGESEGDHLRRVLQAERAKWEGEQSAKEQERQQRATTDKVQKFYREAEKIPGFDREEFEGLTLTRPIVESLLESDNGPKLMAYMAANPAEVERISGLSEKRQALELGKLEARAMAEPNPPKPSKAPAPIRPAAGGGNTTQVHDLKSAAMDDYVAMRRKQGAAWAR